MFSKIPLKFETPDELKYQFYPIKATCINFKIRSPNDAHIALTTRPLECVPMVEIFIGGWCNTKSVIRQNKQKPDFIESVTPNILSASEFRGFWIRWTDNIFTVGREGEAAGFMSWENFEPFEISYVGFCTGWGAAGNWIIVSPAMGCSMNTVGGANSNSSCWKFSSNGLVPEEDIPGGHGLSGETIFAARTGHAGLLIPDKLLPRHFDFEYGDLENDYSVWKDQRPFQTSCFGGGTLLSAWIIEDNKAVCEPLPRAMACMYAGGGNSSASCWKFSSRGLIPEGAVAGGHDVSGETLYVARARHAGLIIPGKLVPSYRTCYVPWNGREHEYSEYEVLCGNRGLWVPVFGNEIPPTAVPAGETDNGETLFIGRANHLRTKQIGRVQPSHGCCYISFGGREIKYENYEVLVS